MAKEFITKDNLNNIFSKAISELATKMQALNTVLDPVINLFKAMGEEDSILGQIVGGACIICLKIEIYT